MNHCISEARAIELNINIVMQLDYIKQVRLISF